jgi:hypothetical protein
MKKNGLDKRFKHFFRVSLLTTILTLGPNCSYFPVTIRRTVTQTAVDILIDGLVQAAGHKDEEHERKLDKVHDSPNLMQPRCHGDIWVIIWAVGPLLIRLN